MTTRDLLSKASYACLLRGGKSSEKNKVENSGGGEHTIKPLLDAPTYDTFPPPPFVHAMSFLWRERAQTRPIPFFEDSKTGFGGRTL